MRRILIASIVALTACDNGITDNECGARYACQVAGVDLAVVSATIDPSESHYSGAVVADPSNVRIHFVVVNRGDQTSGNGVSVEARVFGVKQTVALGPIAPGDSAIGVASLSITRAYLMAGERMEAENAVVQILLSDAVAENNVLTGPRVLLTIPFVSLEPVIAPPQTVRVGERVSIAFRLELGYLIQPLNRQVDVLVCLRAPNGTCTEGNWRPLVRFENILTDRSGEPFLNAEAVPSPAAGVYQLDYCVVPANYPGTFVQQNNPDHHCRTAGVVTVVP